MPGKSVEGKSLVMISGPPVMRTDSPENLATVGGDPTQPIETSWGRDRLTSGQQKGNGPFIIKFLSRPFEESEPDGDGVITKYGFYRTATIDAGGHFFLLPDGETRFVVETSKPPCPPEAP